MLRVKKTNGASFQRICENAKLLESEFETEFFLKIYSYKFWEISIVEENGLD